MQEELVILYCSPTLAGMKTGNIFTVPYISKNNLREEIFSLNRKISPKGLKAIPLKFGQSRALIYIYRPSQLESDLSNNYAIKLLEECGYKCNTPKYCLIQLINRLYKASDFPHEIGLFLGYPPEDVDGFISNNACNYKYTGEWKVYGDEDKAKRTFAKYKKCTEIYYKQWKKGKSIEKLAVAI